MAFDTVYSKNPNLRLNFLDSSVSSKVTDNFLSQKHERSSDSELTSLVSLERYDMLHLLGMIVVRMKYILYITSNIRYLFATIE